MLLKFSDTFLFDTTLLTECDELCRNTIHKMTHTYESFSNDTWAIHSRLIKYRDRISDDFKVRKEKQKDEVFDLWEKSIIEYLWDTHPIITWFSIQNIKKLHILLFPKWVRAKCLSQAWQWYYEIHQPGVWRKNQMWTTVWWVDYAYLPSIDVDNAMNELEKWHNTEDGISTITKTIFAYFIFCEIHPFSDWNGTIWLLIADSIFRRNSINMNWINIYSSWSPEVQLQIFKSIHETNYTETIRLIENYSIG